MLLSTVNELMCSGRDSSSCSTNDTRRVIVRRHEHHLNYYHWVKNSAGDLLVPESIISQVVSVSKSLNLQFRTKLYRNTDYWADDILGD
jgi:hypothetical protein